MQRISDCDRKIISLQKNCEMYNQLYTKEKQDHEEKVAQLFKFQSDFEEHREKSRKDIDEVNVELQKTENTLTSKINELEKCSEEKMALQQNYNEVVAERDKLKNITDLQNVDISKLRVIYSNVT